MAYIGTPPSNAFTSLLKQDFSTSATTGYTLDHAVNNANDIALFINFVRQEPTAAYSASGTTLTLTSATASSDDMYCVYLGQALQTVNPPNASVGLSQLTATGTKDATTFLRGDNSFQEVSSDYVLLSTNDASSVSSVSFDGFFSSTYTNYKIIFDNMTSSASSTWLNITFRRSNTEVTSNYYNANFQTYRTSSSAGDYNNSEWNASNIQFIVLSGSTSYPGAGEFTIYDAFGSSNVKTMTGIGTYWENSGSYRTTITGATLHDNTNALSGVTLKPDSGTISGTINLYGIK